MCLVWQTAATLLLHVPLKSYEPENCSGSSNLMCTLHEKVQTRQIDGTTATFFDNEPRASKRQRIEVNGINWSQLDQLTLTLWMRPKAQTFNQDSRIVSAQERVGNVANYRLQLSIDDRPQVLCDPPNAYLLPTAGLRARIQIGTEASLAEVHWCRPLLPSE